MIWKKDWIDKSYKELKILMLIKVMLIVRLI